MRERALREKWPTRSLHATYHIQSVNKIVCAQVQLVYQIQVDRKNNIAHD